MSSFVALLAGVALLAAGCGSVSATAEAPLRAAAGDDGWWGIPLEIERRRVLPEVTLEDTSGQPVPLRSTFAGMPVLVFFGYTSCPDICPIHLASIASAMDLASVSTRQVAVVFVSVDPERDSRERIAEFLAAFDRGFVGLRGDLPTVQRALDELDLPGPIVEAPDPRGDGALIGHPAQVIGFDADGVARRVWPFGTRRTHWVDDLPRIIEQWTADRGDDPAEART